jgi:hypothetical protein
MLPVGLFCSPSHATCPFLPGFSLSHTSSPTPILRPIFLSLRLNTTKHTHHSYETMSEANFINPSRLSASEQAAALDQSPAKKEKKKRKWGQDVGEIPKLIPPRKRAKTEAEKHQRALERVRRNRDAAEASRKRKHDQREMIENQRDGLQDLTRNLIDMVNELMKQCPNTHLKLEDIPGYEHLDYLLGKPEHDLMSPNELKRAKERVQTSLSPI